MNYSEVLANARQCIGKYCKACPVCNGVTFDISSLFSSLTSNGIFISNSTLISFNLYGSLKIYS